MSRSEKSAIALHAELEETFLEEMATAKVRMLDAVGKPAAGSVIRVVDVKALPQRQAA